MQRKVLEVSGHGKAVALLEPEKAVGAVTDGDSGWIEGYASVFNNLDAQNEVVRPGAFKKTLQESLPKGKIKLVTKHYAHGGHASDVIGTVRRAREDKHGLWVHADLAETAEAQKIRKLVLGGHLTSLSIGYVGTKTRQGFVGGKEVTELLEIRLFEVTITPLPANEAAVITAAKHRALDISAKRQWLEGLQAKAAPPKPKVPSPLDHVRELQRKAFGPDPVERHRAQKEILSWRKELR